MRSSKPDLISVAFALVGLTFGGAFLVTGSPILGAILVISGGINFVNVIEAGYGNANDQQK
jgi:hypothetical protein